MNFLIHLIYPSPITDIKSALKCKNIYGVLMCLRGVGRLMVYRNQEIPKTKVV